MSGADFELNTWEGRIEYQIGRGLTGDEIADAFDHIYVQAGEAPTRAGEWLAWGLLHGRRRILRLIESITSPAQRHRIISIDDVLATRKRLQVEGKAAGEESIAKALGVSASTVKTVRREAGEIPWRER